MATSAGVGPKGYPAVPPLPSGLGRGFSGAPAPSSAREPRARPSPQTWTPSSARRDASPRRASPDPSPRGGTPRRAASPRPSHAATASSGEAPSQVKVPPLGRIPTLGRAASPRRNDEEFAHAPVSARAAYYPPGTAPSASDAAAVAATPGDGKGGSNKPPRLPIHLGNIGSPYTPGDERGGVGRGTQQRRRDSGSGTPRASPRAEGPASARGPGPSRHMSPGRAASPRATPLLKPRVAGAATGSVEANVASAASAAAATFAPASASPRGR